MKRRQIILAVLCLINHSLYSQKSTNRLFTCRFSDGNAGIEQCILLQNNAFTTDDQAEKAVDMILAAVGLQHNFVLVPCPNIKNAAAITSNDGIRYIIYDKSFMQHVNSAATTDWASVTILAHELGHHLCGHTLTPSKTPAEQRQKELEADEFSGFVLSKLDATLDQATAAIKMVSSEGDDTYSDHPNKDNRLAAIEKGYNLAKNQQHVPKVDASPSAEAFFNEGYKLFGEKQYHGAIAKYTMALRIKPNLASAYFYRGLSKDNIRDYSGALSDYNSAIALDTNTTYIYFLRGVVKHDLKDYSGAIADFNKAIENNPDDANAYLFRGITKENLHDYSNALTDFDTAVELKPKDGAFYNWRGVCKANMKDTIGACEDYRKSCNLGDSLGCYNYKQCR